MASVIVLCTSTASAGDDYMRAGVNRPASAALRGDGCVYGGRIWTREDGVSRIVRFRARFELRGKYDSTSILPTYDKTSWYRSDLFHATSTAEVRYFAIPRGALTSPPGKEYSVWAKAVGERPGFWVRDAVRRLKVGVAACERPLYGPGVLETPVGQT
jgi:hypothetical protein